MKPSPADRRRFLKKERRRVKRLRVLKGRMTAFGSKSYPSEVLAKMNDRGAHRKTV